VEAEREQLFAEAKTLVMRLLRTAKSGEARLGHALPLRLAMKFALPERLWPEAAKLVEDRRVVDPVEEALPDVVFDLTHPNPSFGFPNQAIIQAPGTRRFIKSSDLLAALRDRIKGSVRPNGLAGMMKRIGWDSVKRMQGSHQVRGYEQ
jgi:hypothetical protein